MCRSVHSDGLSRRHLSTEEWVTHLVVRVAAYDALRHFVHHQALGPSTCIADIEVGALPRTGRLLGQVELEPGPSRSRRQAWALVIGPSGHHDCRRSCCQGRWSEQMATDKGTRSIVFGRERPSHRPGFPLSVTPTRDTHYRDLPPPTGPEPFHLDLKDIVSPQTYRAIERSRKLTFHVNGDMGGINYAVPQELVAAGMEADAKQPGDAASKPAFLYILGDCVYFNGETSKYYEQFYHPYEFYLGPIFAVPGNHDGENLPGQNNLDGFLRNFCAPMPVKLPESGDSQRTVMIQPNVYWTLLTPLVS